MKLKLKPLFYIEHPNGQIIGIGKDFKAVGYIIPLDILLRRLKMGAKR